MLRRQKQNCHLQKQYFVNIKYIPDDTLVEFYSFNAKKNPTVIQGIFKC